MTTNNRETARELFLEHLCGRGFVALSEFQGIYGYKNVLQLAFFQSLKHEFHSDHLVSSLGGNLTEKMTRFNMHNVKESELLPHPVSLQQTKVQFNVEM